MKSIPFIFLLIISISLVCSSNLGIQDSYKKGETIIGQFSYNFIDSPQESDIKLYRNHVRVPFEPYLFKMGDVYYFYGQAPFLENNYTIKIEDISYKVGKDVSEEDLEQNFITLNETAQFSITPAVIYTKENISIKTYNLDSSTITISASLGSQSESVSILSGEEKTIKFSSQNLEPKIIHSLKVSSDLITYNVPLYLYEGSSDNISGNIDDKSMVFLISSDNIILNTSSSTKRVIYLKNDGEENLTDISLSISPNLLDFISLSEDYIDSLPIDSSFRIELDIVSLSKEQTIEGELYAENNDLYLKKPITLKFVKDYIQDNDNSTTSIEPSCFNIAGNNGFCLSNQICEGSSVNSFEGMGCCIGTCKDKPQSSNGKIIGWILLVGLILFILWFFLKKYRGASRPPSNLLKLGKNN
jgi:hypothetical protein